MTGAVAAGRRRSAPTPPVTDDFTGALSGTKWPGQTSVSNVSGRLRVVPATDYPGVESAQIFDLTQYPLHVEVPTLPIVGSGSISTRFLVSNVNYTSTATFAIEGNPRIIYMAASGPTIAGSAITYDATAHRWLRFRLTGGNLLWETSPDKVTWTPRKTAAAPSWITGATVKAILQSVQTGAVEASPGFAEFDNFNL